MTASTSTSRAATVSDASPVDADRLLTASALAPRRRVEIPAIDDRGGRRVPVLVHVLQDSDKLKIFEEVKRVLKPNGIFIFNFANASGFGFKTDTDCGKTERLNIPETMINLVKDSGLKLEYIVPSYYTLPRIGAHPRFASISSKIFFPFIDSILKQFKNLNLAKVIYVGARKSN